MGRRVPAFSAAPGSPEPISFWNCIARYTSYATTPAAVPNIAMPAAISNHFSANMTCSFLPLPLSSCESARPERSRVRTHSRPAATSLTRRRAADSLCCPFANEPDGLNDLWRLVTGISRNRPCSPSQVMHSASRNESSAPSITIAPLMKVSIAGPRFPRGKKWHEARQFARRIDNEGTCANEVVRKPWPNGTRCVRVHARD